MTILKSFLIPLFFIDHGSEKSIYLRMKFVDAVVGNSSSGIIEAPSLNTATINIGDRQEGRLKADSILDCDPCELSIDKAIRTLYSKDFQMRLKNIKIHMEKAIQLNR